MYDLSKPILNIFLDNPDKEDAGLAPVDGCDLFAHPKDISKVLTKYILPSMKEGGRITIRFADDDQIASLREIQEAE